MLPYREHGTKDPQRPSLLFFHFFGGSHREWDGVIAALPNHHILAVDLPGFGEAAALSGFSVQQMATRLCELIAYLAPAPVVLVGHSMSGKAAMVAAHTPPANLRGLVLIAPSPLAGEPMTDKQRATMSIANTTRDRAEAFSKPGFHARPSPETFELAVEDVLRSSVDAFHAWPLHGAREDWSARIPSLGVPSILVVGADDKAIAPDLQREQTLPLVTATGGQLHLLADTAHLVPYERPAELAQLIDNFVHGLA